MPSAKKDRVTISLHLDKRLYALLKRCSEFEKEPMSRIVDRVLEPHVEKYEADTLGEMHNLDSFLKQERAEEEERVSREYLESQENREQELDSSAQLIADLEARKEKHNISDKLISELKKQIMSEATESEKAKIDELQEKKKAENQRWIEITEKYPLPEGSQRFTVKKHI